MKLKLVAVLFICCVLVNAQTNNNFTKNNLSFDYPNDWELTDDTNDDAQQFTLTKTNSDVQIRGFIHKGKTSPEKLPDAKKAFIDPYIAANRRVTITLMREEPVVRLV